MRPQGGPKRRRIRPALYGLPVRDLPDFGNFSQPAGGSPALPFVPPASAPVSRPAATAIPDTAGRLWHLPPRARSPGVSGGTRPRPPPGLSCPRPPRGILCVFLCRPSLFRGRTIIGTGLKKGGLRLDWIRWGIVVWCPSTHTRQHHDHRFSGMASVPRRSGRFHAPGPQSPPGQRPGTESAGPGDGRHHGGGGPPTPPGTGPAGPGAYTPHGGYVPRRKALPPWRLYPDTGPPPPAGGPSRTRSGEVGSAAGADGPAGHTPGTCPDMGGVCGRAPVKIVPGQDGTCPTAYGRKRSPGKHQGSGPRSGRGTAEHAGSGLPAAAAGPALGGHVRSQSVRIRRIRDGRPAGRRRRGR